MVFAQAKEAAEAAKVVSGWGDQLPALGLGGLGMALIAFLFLRYLNKRDTDARAERVDRHEEDRKEREARDLLFTTALKDISNRAAQNAEECHRVQTAALARELEVVEVLAGVKGQLSTTLSVTQDLGKVVEEAQRELELSRRELERHRP